MLGVERAACDAARCPVARFRKNVHENSRCIAACLRVRLGRRIGTRLCAQVAQDRSPVARATPPGAKTGGVFVSVENTGTEADRLLGVSSPVAGVAELHQMSVDAGVMRMRGVAALEVRPGETLQLKPGGYHVMLSELRQPLKVGDRFPMTLTFQNAGAVEVSVWVEAMGAGASTAHGR